MAGAVDVWLGTLFKMADVSGHIPTALGTTRPLSTVLNAYRISQCLASSVFVLLAASWY